MPMEVTIANMPPVIHGYPLDGNLPEVSGFR
jgi:hypothetical protein